MTGRTTLIGVQVPCTGALAPQRRHPARVPYGRLKPLCDLLNDTRSNGAPWKRPYVTNEIYIISIISHEKQFSIDKLCREHKIYCVIAKGCITVFPGPYGSPLSCSPVPCSAIFLFIGTYVPCPKFPSTYVPMYLCSPVPMFPCPIFPRKYVPWHL